MGSHPAGLEAGRPEPLRTDGSNPFARYSMEVRVPRILEQVLCDHPDWPSATRADVQRLIDEVRADSAFPDPGLPAPDDADWDEPLRAHPDATWLNSPWFLAECNVYRQLLRACRYWETGLDPFAPRKREELQGEALWQTVRALDAYRDASPLERLNAGLAFALWGNRVDLSYAVGTAFGRSGEVSDWLADDRPRVLVHAGAGNVHIVTDNTGSELAMDLALADVWMSDFGAAVTLHVKMHPTFVSDATTADVWTLLSAMREAGGSAAVRAERLSSAFAQRSLRIIPDFFWNGPRFLWDRPARLARELDRADILLLKGDANYRRAIGDAIWPAETSFVKATSYFPRPLVCLRTMKCDALAGISATHSAELDRADPDWRINGRRGLAQIGGKAG
jgi:uncharacterized protein with ATP-grasp and redox domains